MNYLLRFPTVASLAVFIVALTFCVEGQSRVTIKSLLHTVDSLALARDSSSQLAVIECSDIDTSGKASAWTCIYYALPDSDYWFVAQGGAVSFDHSTAYGIGTYVLSYYWMDSDSALLIAERSGGSDIRRRYPTATLSAVLRQYPSPPFWTLWLISYHCPDSVRTLRVDATTGTIVTGVGRMTGRPIATAFSLRQNYPNPFNPSTTIHFDIATRSQVRLSIFNLLGQQVAGLANEEMNAGSYERTWNANVVSGLYFYRIEVVSVSDGKRFVDVKKMVLVR